MTRNTKSQLKARLSGWKWSAIKYYHETVVGRVRAHHGPLSRFLQFPRPGAAPYRRASLAVCRDGGLGDVLMCTPALRRVKELNPNCELSFYTKYPSVLKGLPFIDNVSDWDQRPRGTLYLGYGHSLPPRRHIAAIMGDYLGVCVKDVRPSCTVNAELIEHYQSEWHSHPRPWVVINRFAGPYTPNKDWPEKHWISLAHHLASCGTVIEIGTSERAGIAGLGRTYVNVAGSTSIEQLVAVMATADVHVGPISGPIHIAAAIGIPCVVIYGGYEHPVCSRYPGNIDLYSALPCSPCWLTTACPIGVSCLAQISPQRVIDAIERLLRQPLTHRNRVLSRPPIQNDSSREGCFPGNNSTNTRV